MIFHPKTNDWNLKKGQLEQEMHLQTQLAQESVGLRVWSRNFIADVSKSRQDFVGVSVRCLR